MPSIPVSSQIFDLAFHPTSSLVYTGLLNGEIKAFSYDEQGQHETKFSLRPSKRSCRGLATSEDGSKLWAVGKAKSIFTVDTETGDLVDTRAVVHDAPINRVKCLLPNLLATGDDDGVIKLWDPRKPESITTYTQHFDFISDFLWLADKKQLVATSGDGTLSVMDVRSKKTEPFAHSEDQEDELLSIVPIKGGTKVVVGTQLGILSIFNRKSGWGDCVDRVPGHPHSIDALCALPSSYPSSHSTILTGSSDGLIRAVQLLPTKLLGVIADHGEFPIERIEIDRAGEGRWVGSVGHDEVLRLTDLKDVFEDEDEADQDENAKSEVSGDRDSDEEEAVGLEAGEKMKGKEAREGLEDDDEEADGEADAGVVESAADKSADEDSDVPKEKKKRGKKPKDELQGRKKQKGKNELVMDPGFFSGL
ncbi:WD repeat-containing protein JIP5 [Stereum hirsutum FP-91666 SS1]|uniref:WD repeat-containing protein JIP5 n=1 Tax=Stereum hirsutum (strain FP-91666) TaxID=721885 RepID=UPI000440E752|nr:WD repeat-containing protein JIP5 [Stereum hirsutum FP-91666 SS1]EIM87291.1 WD repeat-containing protein JIP5 [Stereum hirsutum FP-91666 SS1]